MMIPQWFSLPSKVSMLLWHVEPECKIKVMVVDQVCVLLLMTVFIFFIFLLQAIFETVGGYLGRWDLEVLTGQPIMCMAREQHTLLSLRCHHDIGR